MTLHFIIRDKRLHLFANMRSNDVINLLPYDVFHHTFLQRYIANKLEIELGYYHHFATHMYYPKKREREGRMFLEKLIARLEKVSINQHGFKVSELYSQSIDQDMSTAFDILYEGEKIMNTSYQAISEMQLYSICIAVAIARTFKISYKKMRESINQIRDFPGRMQKLKGIKNSVIIAVVQTRKAIR